MYTIQLHNLLFYASHGVYDAERKILSPFEINIDVQMFGSDCQDLSDTLDYSMVHEKVKLLMQKPVALLEQLTKSIADQIRHLHDNIISIRVKVTKLNPDITSIEGSVSVTYEETIRNSNS